MKFDELKTPEDLMNFLIENIKYGYVANGHVFTEPLEESIMDKYYFLRTGEDLIKAGYGVCWDVTELERLFFEKMKILHECYFIQAFKSREEGSIHTFLLFIDNEKWKWFEYTWAEYIGIHEYNTKEDALNDIINKHLKFAAKEQNQFKLFKYSKAKQGLNTFEFVNHCYSGEEIKLSKKI